MKKRPGVFMGYIEQLDDPWNINQPPGPQALPEICLHIPSMLLRKP